MSMRDVDVVRAEHAALVAMIRLLKKGQRWSEVTEDILDFGSATAAWDGVEGDVLLPDPNRQVELDQAMADVAAWADAGWTFLGIADGDYPERLRGIHQAPPFLFAKGAVRRDDPGIAVVGSREATDLGLSIAADVATRLAQREVTVVSGLAAGIDTAALAAGLAAGGRVVGIIGTGISKYYPAVNRGLQDAVAERGLLLSQFWPDAPPQKHTFLMRNAVMSGYSRATLVADAGEKSGARAQARMAVEHGRPVILPQHVVDRNVWAKALVGRPGVHVGGSVDELWGHVEHVLDRDTRVDQLISDLRLTSAS